VPPRYAYWTILVDEQPTAFRAAQLEEIQPTFRRLKDKHPSARLVWFQNGKVWNSRLDAREAMRARGERGRSGDVRQRQPSDVRQREESAEQPRQRDRNWRPGGEHKDPRQKYKDAKKAKWTRFKQNVRKRWETKQAMKNKD
jgi:hypothetical protein